jgi:sugar phosphate isomerase/epimerase
MYRLGAITDELSPNTERALDMAQDFGLCEVEIHSAWNTNVETLTDAQVQVLKKLVRERDLRVCCISSTVFLRCHLADSNQSIPRLPGFQSIEGRYEEHLSALERCLDLANILGAPLVRVFGFWQEAPTEPAIYDQAAEKLVTPIQMAQAKGIRLALENCPHTYFDWGERAAKLVDLIDSVWFQMLWDPCTGLRSGEPDYLIAYKLIQPFLVHVHAKDLLLDPTLKRGRAYVPVGAGQVRWQEILSQLQEDGYQGVVCLETHHISPQGFKEQAAIASFQGLKRIYDETAQRN